MVGLFNCVFFLVALGCIHMCSADTSAQIAQAMPFSQVTSSVAPAWTKHHQVMVETGGSATLAELLDDKPGMLQARTCLCLYAW